MCIRSTGVHFRYYKTEEYGKLTKPKKREIAEWQKSKLIDGNKKPTAKIKKNKMQMSKIKRVHNLRNTTKV